MIRSLKNKLFNKSAPSTKNRPDNKKQNNYYTVSDQELSRLQYHQVAKPPEQNVYIMRRFQDEKMEQMMVSQLSDHQRYYRDNGYLILRDFIPHDLIDTYLKLRQELKLGINQLPQGQIPHVAYQSIRDITCYGPLVDIIRELHSMELGLIFALTGFKSTQRGWHQDAYLDHDSSVPRCASWIALGDVNKDCGPFEYVPGSHQWQALSNVKLNNYVEPDYHWPHGHRKSINGAPRWGRLCEKFVDPIVFSKIEEEKAEIKPFIASKGDVLIWYGRLMHRGSKAKQDNTERPGLIGHYAPVGERERGLFAKRKDNAYFLVPPHSFEKLHGNTDLLDNG